jgi:hypothetical protein
MKVIFNAAVTHSPISNRVHTVSKLHRPGFTRIDPHRNPCQFLRISWLRYGEKTFWVMFKFFLQIFQFRINIRIEPVRTVSTRFNPQRKTASTFVYHITFIVTIRIWSWWKWAKWEVIYATVTNRRISNRVHTELKIVSTRFHPHRNTCQFLRILGATIRRRKHFGHVQNFCAFQTV